MFPISYGTFIKAAMSCLLGIEWCEFQGARANIVSAGFPYSLSSSFQFVLQYENKFNSNGVFF